MASGHRPGLLWIETCASFFNIFVCPKLCEQYMMDDMPFGINSLTIMGHDYQYPICDSHLKIAPFHAHCASYLLRNAILEVYYYLLTLSLL